MRTGVFGVALGLTLSLAIGGATPLAQGGGSAAQPATKKPAPPRLRSQRLRPKPATAAPQKPTPQKPAASTPAKPTTAAIEKLVSEAEAAREANRPEEALALYEKAVKLQPGVRRRALVHRHDQLRARPLRACTGRIPPRHDAAPDNGAAWTLKGLSSSS
jgi:hypothetical protein